MPDVQNSLAPDSDPDPASPDFYRDQALSMLQESKRARFSESKRSFESVSRLYRALAEHVERFHSHSRA